MLALLYATVGQAGGTAYVAAMALFAFPHEVMRPTSLLLNVIAAGYATWRLHRARAIDWRLLRPIAAASLPLAFAGGLLVLPPESFRLGVGIVLLVAAALTLQGPAPPAAQGRPLRLPLASAIGAGVDLASGLTGVGGGVFLAPLLLIGGWATPSRPSAYPPLLSWRTPPRHSLERSGPARRWPTGRQCMRSAALPAPRWARRSGCAGYRLG